MSSAKADLTLQDAVKNTALHLACSKVRISRFDDAVQLSSLLSPLPVTSGYSWVHTLAHTAHTRGDA